jgi:pyruvate,water dikinase
VHRELARRLVDAGVLASSDDVDCLGDAELDRVMMTRAFPPGSLQHRRRMLARAAARPPLPQRFRGRPSPVRAATAAPTAAPSLDPARELALHGWAASAGSYTGTARVIRDATAPNGLEPGDVLVAESTDASWLPLFLRAGAIVVERGGPLSHAAIVARELGLPAVLNVDGATAVLDGRLVTVDGDAGSVEVHAARDAGVRR